jgi:hypothetical protein
MMKREWWVARTERFELRFERLAVCAKRGDAAGDDAGTPRDRMTIKERRGAAVVSGPDSKLNRGRPREGFDTECGNGKIQQPIAGTELPRLRESESHGRRDAAGMGQRGCGISRLRPTSVPVPSSMTGRSRPAVPVSVSFATLRAIADGSAGDAARPDVDSGAIAVRTVVAGP